MDIDERVKYYMGKWYDTKITLNKSNYISDVSLGKILLIKKNQLKIWPSLKHGGPGLIKEAALNNCYANDLYKYIKFNKFYLIAFGDCKIERRLIQRDTGYKLDDLPVIVKAAYCEDKRAGIIAKLNTKRHWSFDITNADIPWKNKKDECIWRGVTTGIAPKALNSPLAQADTLAKEFKEWQKMPRLHFIRKYYDKYNVGFSKFTGNSYIGQYPCWEKLVKSYTNSTGQLKNKYLISLEGNDVASGLKWQLMSNSVVIMPKPTKISWAMEDTLVPYKHYVPLADSLDNLDEVLQWCRENDSTCKEIAENATQYMQQFMDHDREEKIAKEIIDRYDKNVIWS